VQICAILVIRNIRRKISRPSGKTLKGGRDLLDLSENSNMPTMTATTSAIFNTVGLDADTIYDTLVALIGTSVDFGIWLIQLSWPFLLIAGFVYLMVRVAHKFTGLGR